MLTGRALPRFAAMLLLSGVLGGGAFLLSREWSRLFPSLQRQTSDASCNISAGECVSVLPGGGVLRFEVAPKGIPLMKPLSLEVALDGIAVDGVQVDIKGLNMGMGLNRTRLAQSSPHVWRGNTLLPVCSKQVMKWEASVWLEVNGEVLAIPHQFETQRR